MLKDYAFQIRKNIAALLHLIFLILTVAGISLIYLNSVEGDGIVRTLSGRYEDSDGFQQHFQTDLDQVFQYVSYRDVFETDGALDLSKEMFSITRDGPEIIYTLDEVLRYAKSQGFYLNDKFEVVNDLFLYDNASTSRDCIVNWRAYPTDQKILEPGDAYTSLLDLSKEVLYCLSDYYSVYYRMIVHPGNFYFQIAYLDGDDRLTTYTNCASLTPADLMELGRYCYLDDESAFLDTNLPQIPANVTVSMERNNYFDASGYYVAAAVDTSFAADDSYASEALLYRQKMDRCREGIAALFLGILGCLTTLAYLIPASGFRTEDRTVPVLRHFDTVATETCIVLTFIMILFMLFLGEKVGYRLIHILTSEASWDFAERMLRAVIIYLCCLVSAFSLLRRYKCRTLLTGSAVWRLRLELDQYFANRTFACRLFFRFGLFLAVQLCGFAGIGVCIRFWHFLPARPAAILLALLLAAADYYTYRLMYRTSVQEDQVADAIEKISGGDTSYQMPTDSLTGKELLIANQINQIGTGLERALQEQVKSERLKADLITNVSHDIKTPLTSIINYVDLIKREKIQNEHLQAYVRVLEQKSQRLKTLTEDLVEASKASSGNLKIEMTPLNLVEMIWQTDGEFEEKYAERRLELVSSLPDESLMIEADGRHLWRILENLYNNAYKYAMMNSRVYTEVTSENGWAYFTIKNVSENPLNINADELTERFVRGDVSRTTEGSGLGLSIAQSLTKLLGGTFRIIIDGDLFKAQVGFPLMAQPENPEKPA